MLPGEDLNGGGFDGLYREDAGDILLETIQRSHTLVLKKKLEGRVFSVVIEPDPKTTLFDEIIILCSLALLQQDGPGREYGTLLQRGIFFPKGVEVGKPVFEGEEQGDDGIRR